MDLNSLIWKVAEESASVAVVEALKVADYVPGSSPMANYLKMGVAWAVADEIILFFKTNTSHLLEGHYFIVLDEIVWNSAIATVIESLGLGSRAMELVDGLPFGNTGNAAIATGVLKITSKLVAEMIESRFQNTPLSLVRHVSSVLFPNTA